MHVAHDSQTSLFRAIVLGLLLMSGSLSACAARGEEPAKKIVLIGGPKSHDEGEHDYNNGIKLFKALLEGSSNASANSRIVVDTYPYAWPDSAAFSDASTIVLYLDGVRNHPLLDLDRQVAFDALMRKGVGLVVLHQAFTIPEDDTKMDLVGWIGGARYGMFDRVTTSAKFIASIESPVGNGVGGFIHYDEYYPTIRFSERDGKITPVLVGKLAPEYSEGQLVQPEPLSRTVAWTFERKGGGRSFAFSGGHYLKAWDHPSIRKMLLNAIYWTAGIEVPSDGVETSADLDLASQLAFPSEARGRIQESVVSRARDNEVIPKPWGQLVWYVSGKLGNSDTMTVGLATLAVGKKNPLHFHPNCDEVLHVLKGRIVSRMNEESVEMTAGDTVSIPQGTLHSATNIGDEEAVLFISFSSAWRETAGE